MGVAQVSQGIEFDTYFRMILKKLRQMYTVCGKIVAKVRHLRYPAIPLRRGGCRSYSSIIPMVIAQFRPLATPFGIFLFLAQQKNKLSFRCRTCKNNYA